MRRAWRLVIQAASKIGGDGYSPGYPYGGNSKNGDGDGQGSGNGGILGGGEGDSSDFGWSAGEYSARAEGLAVPRGDDE